jgi:hypothetical protein
MEFKLSTEQHYGFNSLCIDLIASIKLSNMEGAQVFKQGIFIRSSNTIKDERKVALSFGVALQQLGKSIEQQALYGKPEITEITVFGQSKKEYSF